AGSPPRRCPTRSPTPPESGSPTPWTTTLPPAPASPADHAALLTAASIKVGHRCPVLRDLTDVRVARWRAPAAAPDAVGAPPRRPRAGRPRCGPAAAG